MTTEDVRHRYVAARKAMEASPEMEVYRRIRTFERSRYVFQKNADELLRELDRWCSPQGELFLLGSVDDEDRRERQAFMLEVTRLLVNFAAGARLLVDHTRVFHRRYYKPKGQLLSLPDEVRRRFTGSEVVQFVHALRNYLDHVTTPPVGTKASFTRHPRGAQHGSVVTQSVSINLGKVLAEAPEEFTGLARVYLERSGGEVDLRAVVAEYIAEIDAFQAWMREQLRQLHRDDLARLRAMEADVLQLQREAFPP